MDHSDLGLRRYLLDTLGVRQFLRLDSEIDPARTAPDRVETDPNWGRLLDLAVVVDESLSLEERDLLGRMMAAAGIVDFDVFCQTDRNHLADQVRRVRPKVCLLLGAGERMTDWPGAKVLKTHPLRDLMGIETRELRARKMEAWSMLKEIKSHLEGMR